MIEPSCGLTLEKRGSRVNFITVKPEQFVHLYDNRNLPLCFRRIYRQGNRIFFRDDLASSFNCKGGAGAGVRKRYPSLRFVIREEPRSNDNPSREPGNIIHQVRTALRARERSDSEPPRFGNYITSITLY